MNVHFSNPHPGRLGADAPCPEAVVRVARELDGTDGNLNAAVEKILDACPEGGVDAVAAVTDDQPCYIVLSVSDKGESHMFRVIEFTPLNG